VDIEKSTHAKSIARHIEVHLQRMLSKMQAIQENDLTNVPVDMVNTKFVELASDWQEIVKVYSDMQGRLNN
jgi:hypothetical protein